MHFADTYVRSRFVNCRLLRATRYRTFGPVDRVSNNVKWRKYKVHGIIIETDGTYLTPRFIASATATMDMPSIMLLHILATSPVPAGPQCTHLEPMEPSRCSAAVNVLSSPPTMNVSVPFSAPTTPAPKRRCHGVNVITRGIGVRGLIFNCIQSLVCSPKETVLLRANRKQNNRISVAVGLN